MRNDVIAKLVWDGESITVPAELGQPRPDQFQGSTGERLGEVCGRICYDSFGKGRDSESYHDHILEVGHLSVHEHFNITFKVECDHEERSSILQQLIGRPGVWWHNDRVTINPRVVLDWGDLKPNCDVNWFYPVLWESMRVRLPKVFQGELPASPLQRVDPMYPEEMWVSLFMGGSRGFSHEQVRHGDFTAISQRSTRYVDESTSKWIWHPLLQNYLTATGIVDLSPVREAGDMFELAGLEVDLVDIECTCQEGYRKIVKHLEPWLKERGLDSVSARKQARGAARGFLGNALYTEMIFSASVAQWNRMIQQRASLAADKEIRKLYQDYVIPVLKDSRYGDYIKYP